MSKRRFTGVWVLPWLLSCGAESTEVAESAELGESSETTAGADTGEISEVAQDNPTAILDGSTPTASASNPDTADGLPPPSPSGTPDSGSPSPDVTSDTEVFVYIRWEGTFPDEGLSDWVSYSNQVALVSVVNERALPTTQRRPEELIGRVVTLRIDESLWLPEGPTNNHLLAGAEVDVVVGGWVLREGVELKAVFVGGPRLEVGGRYVMPLLASDEEVDSANGNWAMLTPASAGAFHQSDVAVTDAELHQAGNASTAALEGLDVEAMRDVLTAATVHDGAEHCRTLPYRERVPCIYFGE